MNMRSLLLLILSSVITSAGFCADDGSSETHFSPGKYLLIHVANPAEGRAEIFSIPVEVLKSKDGWKLQPGENSLDLTNEPAEFTMKQYSISFSLLSDRKKGKGKAAVILTYNGYFGPSALGDRPSMRGTFSQKGLPISSISGAWVLERVE